MTQRRQPRLTQARLTRADEQADQQEQQTARQRVQALTERVAQLLESETPEVRLDVIRNLMAVDDIRIQGVYLIANAYDDNGPRVIYAETPVVLEDEDSVENEALDTESEPELELRENPLALIAIS
ncbi:hypothetical protein MFLAVUS_008852 [Mucor flavus]|uniref:Uncharacterized protein n=1 Tax=Mucor flavus TaxID=439312 RepID=A0ABP9Z893_9FUNG